MNATNQSGPSDADVREAFRRLEQELSHPAFAVAVHAPIGQEAKAVDDWFAGRCPTCHSTRECDCAEEQAVAIQDADHRGELRREYDSRRAFAPARSLPHHTTIRSVLDRD